jgi:hypothetical protein
MGGRAKPPFEDRVFSIVRNFREYRWYGGDPQNAIATLAGHHPDKTLEECQGAFTNYLAAYEAAVQAIWRSPAFAALPATSPERRAFLNAHRGVPESMIRIIIGWVYHWHCER